MELNELNIPFCAQDTEPDDDVVKVRLQLAVYPNPWTPTVAVWIQL